MASNALVSSQELLGGSSSSIGMGQVLTVQNSTVQVRMESGVIQTVYGTNIIIGDWVIVKDNQILGTVASEDAIVVYIP